MGGRREVRSPRHPAVVLHDRFAGNAAAVYDRGRAPYTPAVVAALELPAGRVVDLAAGTGLLTRALLTAGIADVVAVEPSADMRSRLRAPTVLAGTAEATGLPDASADAVVAGDAWHWFDAAAAAAEVHRVLRPGGRLAVVWRGPGRSDRTGPAGELWAFVRTFRPADHHGTTGDAGRDAVPAHGGFTAWEQRTVDFVHRTDAAGLLAEAASISYVNALPPAEREALLVEAARIVAPLDGPVLLPSSAGIWAATRLG